MTYTLMGHIQSAGCQRISNKLPFRVRRQHQTLLKKASLITKKRQKAGLDGEITTDSTRSITRLEDDFIQLTQTLHRHLQASGQKRMTGDLPYRVRSQLLKLIHKGYVIQHRREQEQKEALTKRLASSR